MLRQEFSCGHRKYATFPAGSLSAIAEMYGILLKIFGMLFCSFLVTTAFSGISYNGPVSNVSLSVLLLD
jgi:hypothetical protein